MSITNQNQNKMNKSLKKTWTTEWATYTKGQEITCEYFEDGVTKEVTGLIDYVTQNRYYSTIVLTNGFEYTSWTKLWLELSNQATL